MPLTVSQSGLGAVQGLHSDDQSYRSIGSSTTRPSLHPHLPQYQTQAHQQQQQLPPHNKNQQLLPSSTLPSKLTKMMTTTTTKAANGRHRGRTHSNTTSVIDPSALQYASKFSNSNNNVIVTSAMAGLSSVTGPANSTIMFPQGGLHLHSHHHNNANTPASSNSSTTTTFYSGVKLAPPVLSASIEQLERRASDQKVWYTIQVCPCDLTIITPASASTASSSTGTAKEGTSIGCSGGTGGAVTSIPRKPYKIYRRYEDVADFADQLEDEFAGRMVAPSAAIGPQHDTKDFSNAASTTIPTSGGTGSSSCYVNVSTIRLHAVTPLLSIVAYLIVTLFCESDQLWVIYLESKRFVCSARSWPLLFACLYDSRKSVF